MPTIYENEVKNLRLSIQMHRIAIVALLVISGVALAGWAMSPKQMRIHIPPDLRAGAVIKGGEISAPNVYTFASYMWQQIHLWQTDGDADYPENIRKLAPYFTPSCRDQLLDDLSKKRAAGELSRRTRALSDLSTSGYTDQRVTQLVPQRVWRVQLDTDLAETVYGQPVKRVAIRYPLRIVYYDANPDTNPFGLAVDCIDPGMKPTRIESVADASNANK